MTELSPEEYDNVYLRTRHGNVEGTVEAWLTMRRGHIPPPSVQVWDPTAQQMVTLHYTGTTEYVKRPSEAERDPEWYAEDDD